MTIEFKNNITIPFKDLKPGNIFMDKNQIVFYKFDSSYLPDCITAVNAINPRTGVPVCFCEDTEVFPLHGKLVID